MSDRGVDQLLRDIVGRIGDRDRSAMITTDRERAAQIREALTPVVAARSTIDWVAVNGRRVDVGLTAPPEHEWWVACSIDADGVQSATVLERPRTFPGVVGGRAVIVHGPSSAGKSTVMTAVVERAATPWVMFDELFFGTVRMPFLVWPQTTPTLRRGFIAGITALAAAGNQVILTGGHREDFDHLVVSVPTLLVGLDCARDVRAARQARRTDRWGGLTEATDDTHSGWSYDVRYDTSITGADVIAADILLRADNLQRL